MGSWAIKLSRALVQLLVLSVFAIFPALAGSQVQPFSASSGEAGTIETANPPDVIYILPTERMKIRNYAFDAYGPYPVAGAAVAAGINQYSNAPPEWGQGAQGFGKRMGSDFAIAAIGTTTRYGLAEAFRDDTLYYRCECRGVLPRMRNAVVSTLIARRGQDGHRVFSVPALLAPYAGAMIAVYGWFPDRFGAKDAFRMGNYSMLGYMGGNLALEFLYGGPHSLLARMHLNNAHGSANQGPNP